MDKSAVQKWVDKNAERIKQEFGLDNWRLVINIENLDPAKDGSISAMRVKWKPEYERATIWINFNEIPNEEELAYHFRHELMHIMHSPFELVWRSLWEIFTEDEAKIFGELWTQAEELTVRNLERWHEKQKG